MIWKVCKTFKSLTVFDLINDSSSRMAIYYWWFRGLRNGTTGQRVVNDWEIVSQLYFWTPHWSSFLDSSLSVIHQIFSELIHLCSPTGSWRKGYSASRYPFCRQNTPGTREREARNKTRGIRRPSLATEPHYQPVGVIQYLNYWHPIELKCCLHRPRTLQKCNWVAWIRGNPKSVQFILCAIRPNAFSAS